MWHKPQRDFVDQMLNQEGKHQILMNYYFLRFLSEIEVCKSGNPIRKIFSRARTLWDLASKMFCCVEKILSFFLKISFSHKHLFCSDKKVTFSLPFLAAQINYELFLNFHLNDDNDIPTYL